METGLLMIGLGILFLAAGIAWWRRTTNRRKMMTPWRALITRIKTRESVVTKANDDEEREVSHTVYIGYDYGGKHYERELGHYSIGMREGKEIEIFLDPSDPSKISSRGDRMFSFVLLIFGVVLLAVGL
jgi:hypothetical protein